MGPLADARIVAASPGRLRIALPALYRAPQLKRALETRLAADADVTEVWASPLTGRLLLRFAPALSPAVLLARLGIAVAPAGAAPEPAAAAPPPVPAASGVPLYPPWHLFPADAALVHHASSAQNGLMPAEARRRLAAGSNRVALPPRRSRLALLLAQFGSPPVLLLGASALLSLLTGALAEAAAIGAVLAVNALIGYRTERQAEGDMASLTELVDDHARVLRGGRVARVASADLVPGDVLLLAPGTRIAADLRLFEAGALRIDESALTGESLPVRKQVAPLAREAPLAERCNMAYRGTVVSAGRGMGLVVGTGERTEAGAIEILARMVQPPPTPVQVQLEHLGRQLVLVSGALCLGVVGAGLLRGLRTGPLLRAALALGVAAVPEALPAVATTALARGLRRMRERQVLMRHLHAVEAIGTVSTLCLDKTGTLTMNRMTAVDVRTVGQAFDPRDWPRAAPPAGGALERLLQVCVLCNEAQAARSKADSPAPDSATEAALVALARASGLAPDALRASRPLLSSLLRDEGRRYMRTTHALPGTAKRLLAVKGSPQEVLALCGSYLEGSQTQACDDAVRGRILRQNRLMTERGLRVLGFAYAETDICAGGDEADDAAGAQPLVWLGLVGLADPLRPDVARLIERLHDAGIRPVMLTGDQAGTARQVGQALRLAGVGDLNVVDSADLARAAPAHLRELAGRAQVFARVSPAEKLLIVKAIQAGGARVAMTGDGINDSPALRAADVGIAMGSGTEMALTAADVALKHDRLDTLVEAIGQGRTISDNIRKSVHFMVSSNLSEILIVFGAVLLGGSSPLSPLQLLWINLLTDILPALGLAEEAAEADVMRRPPRDPAAPLLSRPDLLRYGREAGVLAAGTLAAYGYGLARHGSGPRASAIAFDSLVLGQLFHVLACRSDRGSVFNRDLPPNRQLRLGLGATAGLQALVQLMPGLRRLLGLGPLGPLDLLAVLAGAALPVLANELLSAASPSHAPAVRAGPREPAAPADPAP